MAHGTRSHYVQHGCRCEPCSDAAQAYRQGHRERSDGGRRPLLEDAGPIRAHLQALQLLAGLKPEEIAERTGGAVSARTVRYLTSPDRARVRTSTAAALRAVPIDHLVQEIA